MNTVTELYSREALARLRRNNRIWIAVTAVLAAAVLLVCVALCARINTRTAAAAHARIVAVSTLGGWAVIALWGNVVVPGRREAAHQEHMLTGERECAAGELTLTREVQRIPKSAPLLRCELRDGERVRRVSVSPKKAAALGALPRRMKVWLVFGCIVAWEASDERI